MRRRRPAAYEDPAVRIPKRDAPQMPRHQLAVIWAEVNAIGGCVRHPLLSPGGLWAGIELEGEGVERPHRLRQQPPNGSAVGNAAVGLGENRCCAERVTGSKLGAALLLQESERLLIGTVT